MLKIIIAAIICYFIYKYCEAKDYEMPFMAWFGLGALIAYLLS